jgi:outer membrane protein insertion porin family
VQLRIPVAEGPRYRVGEVTFEGNTVVKTEGLARLFALEKHEPYSQKRVQKGFERARELYGRLGYFEFTAYPDLRPHKAPPDVPADVKALPVVDVVLKMQEGSQYFVRRITIAGNTQTRDEVVRREMALYEAGVFNTEALKYSVRRLNQLGYFKPLEDQAIDVQKSPGEENKVDVTLKVEEQNRNQVSFGVGTSEYDGFFASASFSTSNFLGRGETLSLMAQKGTRSNAYQVGISEPYVFGRQVSLGATAFSRKYDYSIYAVDNVDYSRVGVGATITAGVPLRRFLRFFASYGYEVVDTAASDTLSDQLSQGGTSVAGLYLYEGSYRQSGVTPSLVYDTVDNPMTPRRGTRLSASYQYTGGPLGGTVSFIRPEFDSVLYVPIGNRTALGLHGSTGWITNYGNTALPYYLRYALGGETQIRGTNIRTVGPLNSGNAMLGGDKFVLFNAEYYFDVMPSVRALVFHDAGQAFDESHAIDFRELRTSSGVEVRVTLPVIGAPFRLIYAWNVYRDAFQPARTFKFAVGSTF